MATWLWGQFHRRGKGVEVTALRPEGLSSYMCGPVSVGTSPGQVPTAGGYSGPRGSLSELQGISWDSARGLMGMATPWQGTKPQPTFPAV